MHKHLSEMGLIKFPSQRKHEMIDNTADNDVIIDQRCGLQRCAFYFTISFFLSDNDFEIKMKS